MIIGKYKANHNKGEDLLELKEDGTYIYQFITPDGKEIKNTNKWELEYLEGRPIITFLRFSSALSKYSSQRPGFWIVEVEKSFFNGNIRLCIDPDLGYYYVKKKPSD
jgi:hypothetical protein